MIERLKSIETALAVFFALFGGAARFVLSPPRERSLRAVAASLFIAGFSGVLMWALLESRGYDPFFVAAGAGVGGLVGDDLLKGIMKLGEKWKDNPSEIVDKTIDKAKDKLDKLKGGDK